MNHPPQQAIDYLSRIGEIETLFKNADYIGLKTIDTADRLEAFLPKFFSYRHRRPLQALDRTALFQHDSSVQSHFGQPHGACRRWA
jgi:hypothetical protein